jgi:hypothetical protein
MTAVAIAMQRAPQRTPGWVKTSTTKFVNIVGSGVYGETRLPTDAIGTTTVTFDGVVAGSEIRVYDPDLNELAGIETCVANQALTWPVYAAGSPNNNVQIKIINTAYKIKDFLYTSKVGNQFIPVQMEPDPWFNNPA